MARKKKATKPTLEELKVEASKLKRYDIRNTLFRIRDNRVEKKQEALAELVWAVIQPQLKSPESIKNFTFKWDVNPEKPSQVIRREEWEKRKEELYPEEYKKQEQVEEEITLFTGQG